MLRHATEIWLRKRAIAFVLLGILVWTGRSAWAAEPRLVCELDVDDFKKSAAVAPPYEYMAIADDGTQLATAGPNNTIALWDCQKRALRQYLTPARAPASISNTRPMAVSFSPDGKELAALRGLVFGAEKDLPKGALLLRTWATDTGRPGRQQEGPHTLLGSGQQAWYAPTLAYSTDGKKLAAGYSTVPFSWPWTGEMRSRLPVGMHFPKDSFTDLNGSSQTVIGILHDDAKTRAEIVNVNWGFVRFAFLPGGTNLAVWDGSARSIAIHDLTGKAAPRRVAELSERNWFAGLRALAITKDGNSLIALCTVNLRAAEMPAKPFAFKDDGTKIRLARFDLSQSNGGSGVELPVIDVVRGTLELAADATAFLAQSDTGSLKVYDSATAKEIAALTLPDQRKIETAALSRSGRFVAMSSKFGFIQVWELDPPGMTD